MKNDSARNSRIGAPAIAGGVWKALASLRLTVALLALGVLLVFVGTLAQADEGLYTAQERYFRRWIVWGVSLFGRSVPLPLPGGYLLGTLLLANLLSAHVSRFRWAWGKLGIHLSHAGIVVLLVGQMATDLASRETQMRFAEGETRSYSESPTEYELAFVAGEGAGARDVATLPARRLARNREVRPPGLPLAVRVKDYWPNSEPEFRAPSDRDRPPLASSGLARHFDFRRLRETRATNERNVPTAVLEIVPERGPSSTWVASGWSADEALVSAVRASYEMRVGRDMASRIADRLLEPQRVEAGGESWSLELRPARERHPFSITLLETTHRVYPGTDIPRDFRSRVRIENPGTGENREAEIFMNNPLRYGGLTFYQFQMGRDELHGSRGTSTLQVVRNPSWFAPYLGCLLVGVGMTLHFVLRLGRFVSRRRAA